MMGDDALFNLRWDARRTALLESVAALYRDESFVDVTVATNGEIFKAHKLLLSASSPFLKSILESVPSQHAVLFMPHVSASDLSNVLKFIYEGEIKINRRALKSFLETAKLLKINGMDFDLEEELTDLDSINQSGQSNGNASSSSGSVNPNRTASPSAVTKASTTTTNQKDDDPPEKLKILSALLLNKKESQGSQSDSGYSTIPSSSATQANLSHANSSGGRSHLSNLPELRDLKNGSHMSHVGEELEESEDDVHNDLDMVIEDENSRSHQRMISMDGDGELIDIDEDEMQEYDEEDEDDISILPEVSLQESEESYSISSHHLQQALKMRSGQSISPGQGYGSQQKGMGKLRPILPKNNSSGGYNEGILLRMMREPLLSNKPSPSGSTGSATAGSGSNYYEVGHTEGVGGLRKTKRYVQCGSCSKVLSSLSALKRHMEDVHCARIQGKCIICGRVYSSRNSLLTHVYSAHKKHHDYKAVARIIRESDFEKFATA